MMKRSHRQADSDTLHRRAIDAYGEGALDRARALMAEACAGTYVPASYRRDYAEILMRCGDLAGAETAARLAAETEPDRAGPWMMLGTILAMQERLNESQACFRKVVALDPHSVRAHNNLAVILQRQGRLRESESHYRAALAMHPDDPEILSNYAALLGEQGCFSEALEIVEQLLQRQPDWMKALLLAAELESDRGRWPAALKRLDQALETTTDALPIRRRRVFVLHRMGRSEEALAECDTILETHPTDSELLHLRALTLQGMDRVTDALCAFETAAAADAAPASVGANHAWLLAEMGMKSASLSRLDDVLQHHSDLTAAWYYRAALTRYEPGHPDLLQMERLLANPDVRYRCRIGLSFALGKAYLDIGDGARAFAYLTDANRLQRQVTDYDPAAMAKLCQGILATCTPAALERLAEGGDPSTRPIFVFGMPRSGTTLVEQILSSHPAVHGAGEPRYLADLADEVGYPEGMSDLTPDACPALAARYLARISDGVPETQRVVDKMPPNFLYAGLIRAILPNARLIHCRRDPVDTCLSAYALRFARGQDYSYDLAELGQFYGLYRAVMAHWRATLPAGTLFEIDYEDLVRHPEREIRRLLDFCGLPWDEACLTPHRTRRRVTSASLDQVRSPIHTNSIGRSIPFQPWLETLMAALRDNGVIPAYSELIE